MFLKRKLKIYLVMLSILALYVPINAMKNNEINKNIINTNEIKAKNFGENEKEEPNSESNIKINSINNKLNEIKKDICETKEDLKNIKKNRIINLINYFNFHTKNLLTIKEKTNDKKTINSIDDVLNDIDKIINTLTITKIKKDVCEIKEQDFENMNINNFIHYMNDLNLYKQNFLALKEKTTDKETENIINNLLNYINKFIIVAVKLKIEKIKEQDSKNIYMNNIYTDNIQKYRQYKNTLKFYVDYLITLKSETNNQEIINSINDISKNVNILIIEKIKKNINEIKEKNSENINKNNINYIDDLKTYKKDLLILKNEPNNEETPNTINNILNDIEKLIV